MGTGADRGAELTAGLGSAAVASELPQILGSPPCSSPSVLHLSPEPGTRGVGGEVCWAPTDTLGGAQPLPRSTQGVQPVCEGIKTFCAWETRSVCESEDGLVLGVQPSPVTSLLA